MEKKNSSSLNVSLRDWLVSNTPATNFLFPISFLLFDSRVLGTDTVDPDTRDIYVEIMLL